MAVAWLESGWLTGAFVVAVIVSLIMFDAHNTRPWHNLGLVIVGVVIRVRDRRKAP